MNKVLGGGAVLSLLAAPPAFNAEPIRHYEPVDGALPSGIPDLDLGGGANAVSPYPR